MLVPNFFVILRCCLPPAHWHPLLNLPSRQYQLLPKSISNLHCPMATQPQCQTHMLVLMWVNSMGVRMVCLRTWSLRYALSRVPRCAADVLMLAVTYDAPVTVTRAVTPSQSKLTGPAPDGVVSSVCTRPDHTTRGSEAGMVVSAVARATETTTAAAQQQANRDFMASCWMGGVSRYGDLASCKPGRTK